MLRRLLGLATPLSRTIACLALLLFVAPNWAFAQRIAGGDNFTLIVTPDGNVWSFGNNSTGQLGHGTTSSGPAPTPTQIQGLSGVQAVAAGINFGLALTTTGTVYAWGSNNDGQLGTTDNIWHDSPVQLGLSNVVAIAAGRRHGVALTATGEVLTWGENDYGQLGNGGTTDTNTPATVFSNAIAIGAGQDHTVVIKNDATAWAWGRNGSGQLGNDDPAGASSATPVQMIGVSNAVAVSGGVKHTVVRLANGSLLATGENSNGELGDGTPTDRRTAVPVLSVANAQHVAVGMGHNLAVDAAGALWVWGEGVYGALGTGTATDMFEPQTLASLTGVAYVGVGWDHSIAADTSGIVSTWGVNHKGELGDGTTDDRWLPEAISGPNYDWRVGKPAFSVAAGTYTTALNVTVTVATPDAEIRYTLNGSEPTQSDSLVASGGVVSIDASKTLKAKAWKTGMPSSAVAAAEYTLQVVMPTVSPSGGPFTSAQSVIMATTTSGAAIRYTTDGTDPTASSTLYGGPVSVNATTTVKSAGFKTGWTMSPVKTATLTFDYGTLDAPSVDPATGTYAGGVTVTMSSPTSGATIRYTTNGTAPSASSTAYSAPFPITQTSTVRAKAFHGSYSTSPETTRTYTIAAATPTLSTASGSYAPGSLVTISTSEATATLRMTLDGSDPTSTSPIVASGTTLAIGNYTLKVRATRSNVLDSAVATATYTLTSALGPGAVSTGGAHTIVAASDGRLYVWGNNGNGQLGKGNIAVQTTPIVLNTITGVTAVSGGLAHTLALRWDGQLYAFGSNVNGRLGDGTTDQKTLPVHVSTLSNIIAIAVGDAHNLALRSDGHVFVWGANASGQLGLGDSGSGTDRLVPTEILTLSNIVAIAAGDSHSFAVTANGQLYAWGANGNARLGIGTTPSIQNTPALVPLSNVAAVATGQAHTLAMTGAGRVYGWGANSNGQVGVAATTTVSTPTLVANLHVSTIGAGDNHSAAIRADGALLLWGNSGSGQVGNNSTTTTISVPTVISGPSSVSTISLGDLHSVAVTSAGEVWSWGESSDGRLGNGTTSPDRLTPQSVLTSLSDWRPAAPTIDVPPGTLGAAQMVTLTASTSGSVIRYTQNGTTPTDADAEVPANGQVEIAYSSLLRARAFASGRQPSAIGRSEYELQSAAPVISPGTGTYSSVQMVTIAETGVPGTIRYTLNGTEPSETSTLYSGPFSVSTAITVKAKTFPSNGWSASPTATATLSFNYGTLDTPVAMPGGGGFQQAPQVTLSSNAAIIRYTLDGTTPTESSTLYTGPFVMPEGGGDLKAKAFQADWTPSAVMMQTYVIDTAPPAIIATVSPTPNAAGWNNSPVTVTFTCSDNVSGAVDCPAPVSVTQDGSGQLLTRSATDAAGNSASISVALNIDRVPPTIELTSAVPSDTTDATLAVSAAVGDTLSGVVSGVCSGTSVSVASGTLDCTLALKTGRNVVLATAVDAAGNTASASARTVRITTDPIDLTVTPATAGILVGETRVLAAVDQFGRVPAGVAWSSNDEQVATISTDEDGIVSAVGLGGGTATLTATLDSETTTMTLTVYAGATLPIGTPRWTAPERLGIAGADTVVLSGLGDADAIYSVEYATSATGNKNATVRAYGVDGGEHWFGALPAGEDETITKVMPHALGGVIAVLHRAGNPAAIIKYSGDGESNWRYQGGGWRMQAVTGGNGTVFVVEELAAAGGSRPRIVVLNGTTGAVVSQQMLPQFVISWGIEGRIDESWGFDLAGFTVDAHGHARFLLNHGGKYFPEDGVGGWLEYNLDLYDVAPDGTISTTQIDSLTRTPVNNGYYIVPESLTPDSEGVLALYVRRDSWGQEEQWNGKYFGVTNSTFTLPGPWRPTISSIDGYGIGRGTEPTDPLTARSLRTGVMSWQNTVAGDPILSSGSGAGAVQASDGIVRDIASDGTVEATSSLPGTGLHAFGRFHIRGASNTLQALTWKPVNDLTSYVNDLTSYVGVSSGVTLTQAPNAFGLFVKTHVVAEAVSEAMHAALRLVPRRQSDWQATAHPYSQYFREKPAYYGDLHYATVGAGTNSPVPSCNLGYLTAAINRDRDFKVFPVHHHRLPVEPADEDSKMLAALNATRDFQNGVLEYYCWPEPGDQKYNSNSFLHGLLLKVVLPEPTNINFGGTLFPGWSKPVPAPYYSPPQ